MLNLFSAKGKQTAPKQDKSAFPSASLPRQREATLLPHKYATQSQQEIKSELLSLLISKNVHQFNITATQFKKLLSQLEPKTTSKTQWDHIIVQGNGTITTYLAQIVYYASHNASGAQILLNRIILEGSPKEYNWNFSRTVFNQTEMTLFSQIVYSCSQKERWAQITLDALFKNVPLIQLDFNAVMTDDKVTPLWLLSHLALDVGPKYLIEILRQHFTNMQRLNFNIKLLGTTLMDVLFKKGSHFATWIYLTTLKVEQPLLSLETQSFLDDLQQKMHAVAIAMWHFAESWETLPAELVLLIYRNLARDCLKDYLVNIPKEYHESILDQAINKRFVCQISNEERAKWQKFTQDRFPHVQARSFRTVVILGAKKIYDQTPIHNPNLLIKGNNNHPALLSLLESRIRSSLEELKNQKTIPTFIPHFHRTLIIEKLSHKKDLTKSEIKEVIISSFAESPAKK